MCCDVSERPSKLLAADPFFFTFISWYTLPRQRYARSHEDASLGAVATYGLVSDRRPSL
jgi:hypothetical protein